jgi:hypothetical protein
MALLSGLRGLLYSISKVAEVPEVPKLAGREMPVTYLGAERGSVGRARCDVLCTGSRLIAGAKRWAA